MLLKELIRFSTQHRTLYCYMILSVWIFLLITVMYKYIGNTNNYNTLGYINGKRMVLSTISEEENSKLKKYQQECTPLENILKKDDGGILDGWQLQGILLVIRHGDRGPISHVRGISKINCGVDNGDILLNRYKSFLINSTNTAGTNKHKYWNKLGPFHGFALLPRTEKICLLGQLTYKGITQLLHLGEILQQVYSRSLGLYLKPSSSKTNINSTPNSFLNSDEVIVFTTRYHRTFQSAMALMFTFLPQDKWLALNLHESYSMTFCFSDCTCAQADVLRKHLSQLRKENLSQHSAVAAVVQWIGQSLFQHLSSQNVYNNPRETMDAVLTLICHNASLPCKKNNIDKLIHTTTTLPTVDQNDVINIDQDEIPAVINTNNQQQSNVQDGKEIDDNEINNNSELDERCIEQSHIGALMSFTNWQSAYFAQHPLYKHIGLLRAYGMIRHIVSYMLKMISGDRTKLVLYSGHDYSMKYLTAALGISTETDYIPYASRLAFEVYRSDSQTDYYFRVIYNGKDVTQEIDFCEGGKSLRVTRDSRGNKADLCPIENIIRFIHDDYFSPLNVTNFKDACLVTNHKY